MVRNLPDSGAPPPGLFTGAVWASAGRAVRSFPLLPYPGSAGSCSSDALPRRVPTRRRSWRRIPDERRYPGSRRVWASAGLLARSVDCELAWAAPGRDTRSAHTPAAGHPAPRPQSGFPGLERSVLRVPVAPVGPGPELTSLGAAFRPHAMAPITCATCRCRCNP